MQHLFREIDFEFHFNCANLRARLVTQSLFDVYRDGDGDMQCITDLLCDYDTLRKHFETPGWF